jgi:hypothetical protein
MKRERIYGCRGPRYAAWKAWEACAVRRERARGQEGVAAKQQQETPRAKTIVAHSYVPGLLGTTFSLQEMVKVECNFLEARKLFSHVSSQFMMQKLHRNRMMRSASTWCGLSFNLS